MGEVMASREMALVLVAGLACGWSAGAVPAARADTINACVGPGGQVRVPGSGGGCKGNETPLSLSTQGIDTVVTDFPVSSFGGGGPVSCPAGETAINGLAYPPPLQSVPVDQSNNTAWSHSPPYYPVAWFFSFGPGSSTARAIVFCTPVSGITAPAAATATARSVRSRARATGR
jgi:hypothetical protein